MAGKNNLRPRLYPSWANHMMHTTCMISQLIEMITSLHTYPSRTKGLLTSVGFGFVYLGWVLCIAHRSNIWVYPFLEKFSHFERTIFIGGSSVLLGIFFLGGEFLTYKVWSFKVKEENPVGTESSSNETNMQPPIHNYNTRSRKKVAKTD